MIEFTRKQNEELLSALKDIDKSYDISDCQPDLRLSLIGTYMEILSQKLKDFQFDLAADEIFYFKSVLPPMLSLSIYYTEIFELENVLLVGTPKAKTEYLQKTFNRIDDFFQENAEFFRYYRFGKTYLDEQYFNRVIAANAEQMRGVGVLKNQSCFPTASLKIASILVYTRLESELRQRLGLQSSTKPPSESEAASVAQPDTSLIWTDTKSGLVELIYSLKEVGAFNHGKATLKEITEGIEKAFSISIDNPTRKFQELNNRKVNTTMYLDEMKAKFLERTDRNNERHMTREAKRKRIGNNDR